MCPLLTKILTRVEDHRRLHRVRDIQKKNEEDERELQNRRLKLK